MLYIIAAAVHILVCLLVFIGIKIRVLSVHKYMFFVALLIRAVIFAIKESKLYIEQSEQQEA